MDFGLSARAASLVVRFSYSVNRKTNQESINRNFTSMKVAIYSRVLEEDQVEDVKRLLHRL